MNVFNIPENYRKIVVIGDIHGDINTVLSIVKNLKENYFYIFLGDYADRGEYNVEVIDKIRNILDMENVVALKGNHESYTKSGKPLFSPCTLINEVERKIGNWKTYFKEILKPFIDKLYIGAILKGKILFVHGGVSSKIKSISDIKKNEIDILWSDPFNGEGEIKNFKRGIGVLFGVNVSKFVCTNLGVKVIIRSHEPRKALLKPFFEHNGRVVTVSSTTVYGGKAHLLLVNTQKLNMRTVYL